MWARSGCPSTMAEPSTAAAPAAEQRIQRVIEAAGSAGRGAEGAGVLVVRFDGRSSAVLRIEARYPLKLLHLIDRRTQLPRHTATAAHVELPLLPPHAAPVVQMLGYGGGLLSADRLSLDVRLLDRSSLLLTTPAHGRAYKQCQPAHPVHIRQASGRSVDVSGSEVRHSVHLGPSSLLLFVPSAVSLFAHSSLATATTVRLHSTASVLLVDVIAGGRLTQGEQFGHSVRYSATTTVHYTDAADQRVPAMRDRTVLLAQHCHDDGATVGRFQARGTVLLLGPHLLPLAIHLFLAHNQRTVRKARGGQQPASQSTECVVSAAWVCGSAPDPVAADCVVDSAAVQRCVGGGSVSGGCLLRLLSAEVESLLHTVGRLLSALDSHMQGAAPWQRV